jgi:23S rRNA (cytidine2498-2'-O)-methyltransferase
MAGDRLLFSAADDYLEAATAELREVYPDATFGVLAPDLGWIQAEGLNITDLAVACRQTPTIFVRHLMREIAFMPAAEAQDIDDVIDRAVEAWLALPLRTDLSLQVWLTGESPVAYRPDELRLELAAALSDEGIAVERAGQQQILGVAISPAGISLGLNGLASALVDWPGGRVRLARPKGQVSRSEFKLEELFRVQQPNLPKGGVAIDLGASPGGWSRILRQYGFTVWAVDPGQLDPRLASDAGIRHVKMTAGPFLRMTDVSADLIVNDMRMDPDLSTRTMLDAAIRLKPHGMMIQTLKVTPHDPRRTVRQALETLRAAYDIEWAGQLQHNRNEVTVVGRKQA